MHLFYGFIKEKVEPQKGRIIKFRSKRNFDEEHYKQDLVMLHGMLARFSTQLMIKLVSGKYLWLV